MLGIPGSHLIRQMLRTRMESLAKCFAPTLRLNPSPASETGMPYLHLGEPGMPSQLRVNFPRRLMQNLESGVLQGKTTSNLVDCIYLLTEQLHIKVGRMRRRLCFVRAPEVLFVVRVLEGRGLGTLEGMLQAPSPTFFLTLSLPSASLDICTPFLLFEPSHNPHPHTRSYFPTSSAPRKPYNASSSHTV